MRNIIAKSHLVALQSSFLFLLATVFSKTFERMPQRAGGLVIAGGDSFFLSESAKFAEITVRHKVPAIFHGREFAAAGGLLSYGASVVASYLLAGVYTGRILRGERPGDLPVQRSSKLEIYINLNTAKALGVTIPQGLMQFFSCVCLQSYKRSYKISCIE